MLDYFFPSLHIDCARTAISIRHRSRFRRRSKIKFVMRQFDKDTTWGAMTDALRAMLNDLPCRHALTTVTICDAWCRLFVIMPPENAVHRRDCEAALAMRFHHLYGDAQDAWVMQADWQVDAAFLGAAMPRALHATLVALGAHYQLRFTAIVTKAISVWNRSRQQLLKGDWFVTVCADSVTVIATDNHGLRTTFHQRLLLTERRDSEWLATCVNREALRQDLPLPNRIVIDGDIPACWLHSSDQSLRYIFVTDPSYSMLDATPLSGEVTA